MFSAVTVCSNPCVGPYPWTNMSFFLLSIWAEELVSAPKINIFWPNQPLGNKKLIFYQTQFHNHNTHTF